ncbi:MAG: MBL fold metallo-hydrolase [Alphaproteobacteria bacterium]|nr:MBL fold metallo-hydrolase [Alphaproteobacteria bacterium]TAD90728.1 MAG: MBL fold metallo-hydrolase [Alphaproteobacteria bacterium]
MTVEVTFWGVRGSFPCATPQHMEFGGNTSCVSVSCGDEWLILDAGTGIWQLGKHLARNRVQKATLLLSHSHTDHIVGFPFFAPAWMGHFDLTIMAGHLHDKGGVRDVFAQFMRDPVFPVQLDNMGGRFRFVDFPIGKVHKIGPFTIKTAPLNHPNGACGYRIEAGGKSVAYVTDTEHTAGTLDKHVLKLIDKVDLFIYDATYTDDEYKTKVGWGHSTWQEGVRLARKAHVRQYCIFHHDPEHTDDRMHAIEAEAKAMMENCFVARERSTITL